MLKPATQPAGRMHQHLLVADMKRSIDFYVTVLGFFYDHGVPEVAWLTREGMLLTLSPGTPAGALSSYFGWSVGGVDELQRHYDELYQRRQRLSAPPDAAAGRLYFFLYDPDDYPICFSYDQMDYAK